MTPCEHAIHQFLVPGSPLEILFVYVSVFVGFHCCSCCRWTTFISHTMNRFSYPSFCWSCTFGNIMMFSTTCTIKHGQNKCILNVVGQGWLNSVKSKSLFRHAEVTLCTVEKQNNIFTLWMSFRVWCELSLHRKNPFYTVLLCYCYCALEVEIVLTAHCWCITWALISCLDCCVISQAKQHMDSCQVSFKIQHILMIAIFIVVLAY